IVARRRERQSARRHDLVLDDRGAVRPVDDAPQLVGADDRVGARRVGRVQAEHAIAADEREQRERDARHIPGISWNVCDTELAFANGNTVLTKSPSWMYGSPA